MASIVPQIVMALVKRELSEGSVNWSRVRRGYYPLHLAMHNRSKRSLRRLCFTRVCHSVHGRGGGPGQDPVGRLRGLARGVSRPRHGGGGVQAQAWGCLSQQTATAADGMHPTGMHSCFDIKLR